MTRGLLRVVEEGRMERKKEGELLLRCFQEEQRVYQVALVAIAHIAVWPQAQAFLEENKPNCVHCLYRNLEGKYPGSGSPNPGQWGMAAILSRSLARGAKVFLGVTEDEQNFNCDKCGK